MAGGDKTHMMVHMLYLKVFVLCSRHNPVPETLSTTEMRFGTATQSSNVYEHRSARAF